MITVHNLILPILIKSEQYSDVHWISKVENKHYTPPPPLTFTDLARDMNIYGTAFCFRKSGIIFPSQNERYPASTERFLLLTDDGGGSMVPLNPHPLPLSRTRFFLIELKA